MAYPFDNDPFMPAHAKVFAAARLRNQMSGLPNQDQPGIGTTVLNGGLSGLGMLGSILDKPARAVRGILGGHHDEALAALPFSDTFGITDPERAVSGRDITDNLKITKAGDQGWGSWGAGLGAEIGLDPLTYLTFGAKTALKPVGVGLKNIGALQGVSRLKMLQGVHALEPELIAAGHTPEAIAHMRNQGKWIADQPMIDAAKAAGGTLESGKPLSGLAGIGSPFSKYPAFTVGHGAAAQKIAEWTDRGLDRLRFGNPVGRAVGSLFDPSVNGAVDEITQKGWATHGSPALEAARMTARADQYATHRGLAAAIDSGRWPERDVLAAHTSVLEGAPTNHLNPDLVAAVSGTGLGERAAHQRELGEARYIGSPLEDAGDSLVHYGPRRATAMDPQSLKMQGQGIFPITSASNMHRAEQLREIPGGTTAINQWSVNPLLSGPARTATSEQASRRLKKDMWLTAMAQGIKPTRDFGKQLDVKATGMADYLHGLNPAHATDNIPLYNPDVLKTLASRGEAHARTTSAAKALVGTLGDAARPISALGPDAVPLSQALAGSGLVTHGGDLATGVQAQGAAFELLKRLAARGAGPTDPLKFGSVGDIHKAIDQYGVSREHWDQISKAYGKWSTPEELKTSKSTWDSVTGAFKNLTYPIWPASHVRNLTSALITNTIDGTPLSAYPKQWGIMRGNQATNVSGIPGMPSGLSSRDRAEFVRGQQFATGKVFSNQGMNAELPGGIADTLRQGGKIIPPLPGSDRVGKTGSVIGDTAHLIAKEGLLDTLRNLLPNPLKGLEMRGVFGGLKDFPLLEAGRKVGANLEDLVRGANMIGNMEKGMSPAMAGQNLNKIHFDYGNHTNFEKNWMRKFFPFYTFARKNLPLQLEHLVTRPRNAQLQLRPLGIGQPGSYVPNYLSSGAAIPVGDQGPDGTQRYVSQLGTPLEEAFERYHFKNGRLDPGRTILSYFGMGNPLIKGPLESLFNTQFHTGRPLTDLRAPGVISGVTSHFGEDNPQTLSQILMNTPLTRFISGADKLADDRKGVIPKALNMLTGLRVSDVDTGKTKYFETRDALRALMDQNPAIGKHTSYYFRPGEAASASPEELSHMRAMQALEAQARIYAERMRTIHGQPGA